jgi:hypothetical protein
VSQFLKGVHLGGMTIRKSLAMTFVVALVSFGCETENALLSVRDGAAGSGPGSGGVGSGGVPGLGGATALGAGGATSPGSGGRTSVGAGGVATGSGGGSGGAGGAVPTKDGGGSDSALDSAAPRDASDGGSGCGPGYPVGSTKPLGDGCNICTCQPSGLFTCSTATCPPADAAMEAGQCPAGQMWCAGCEPGTGACDVVCPGRPCLIDAAVASDTGSGTCAQLTSQDACEARSDCHSVFYDPGTCGCASPGCCARFSSCKEGAKAVCVSPAPGTGFCDMVTPVCEGPYVIAYTTYCYEGCVLNTECGP